MDRIRALLVSILVLFVVPLLHGASKASGVERFDAVKTWRLHITWTHELAVGGVSTSMSANATYKLLRSPDSNDAFYIWEADDSVAPSGELQAFGNMNLEAMKFSYSAGGIGEGSGGLTISAAEGTYEVRAGLRGATGTLVTTTSMGGYNRNDNVQPVLMINFENGAPATSTGNLPAAGLTLSGRHDAVMSFAPFVPQSPMKVEWTLEPWEQEEGPKVALEGCSEIAVDQQSVLTAKGDPSGGSYRFWAEPSSPFDMTGQGASATIRGSSPGTATLHVEYTLSGRRPARASQSGTAIQVVSINGGEPIPKIGLFDIDGKRTTATQSVPLSVQPAHAGDRLAFRSVDPAIVTAVSSGNSVLLQGLRIGQTQIQGATKCGGKTGPTALVEVVWCDDDVLERLAKQEEAVLEYLKHLLEQDGRLRNGSDFDEAMQTAEAAGDLLVKTGGLIISTLSIGAGKSVQTASDLYSAGSTITGQPPDAQGSALQAFAMLASNAVLGAALAGQDAIKAATRFGNSVGALIGTSQQLEDIRNKYEEWTRRLEDVVRRKKLCRLGTGEPQPEPPRSGDGPPASEDGPSGENPPPPRKGDRRSDQPPGETPQSGGDRTPAGGGADLPPPQPGDGPPLPPPTPPPPPPGPGGGGLLIGGGGCGCRDQGAAGLAVSGGSTGQLLGELANLDQCVSAFTSGPLTGYVKTLDEWNRLFEDVQNSPPTEAELGRLHSLLEQTNEFDEAGRSFLGGFEPCPQALEGAAVALTPALPENG